VTLTLTSDRVIWHTAMYHSSISVYTANLVEIRKTFVDGHTDVQMDTETAFIRSTRRSQPKGWLVGWLWFNGILSTQVAAISCLSQPKKKTISLIITVYWHILITNNLHIKLITGK